MFPGLKVVFVSDNKDQINYLNYYLKTQKFKPFCDGRVLAVWKTSYEQCLFKGAIFADDMQLTDVKWVTPTGYIRHTMSHIANAARTALNPNSLSKFIKKMCANPFPPQTPPSPQQPEQDQ